MSTKLTKLNPEAIIDKSITADKLAENYLTISDIGYVSVYGRDESDKRGPQIGTIVINGKDENGNDSKVTYEINGPSAADLGLSSALKYVGFTTFPITDNSTTSTITINDKSYTASAGDVVFYSNGNDKDSDKEFVWNGSKWEELGTIYVDTKNTAGSTNSDEQLFLVGTTSQTDSSQTYSHKGVFIDKGHHIYSNYKKVDMDLIPTLNATGTEISQNDDLQTIKYLNVGKYYSSTYANTLTVKNCPARNAFSMNVYVVNSPATGNESTGDYVYRIRHIIDINGLQFIQSVSTSGTPGVFTFGDWMFIPTSKAEIDATDLNGSNVSVGNSSTPIYINSNGVFTACTNVSANSANIANALNVATTISTADDLDNFIEGGKVKFGKLSANLTEPVLYDRDGLIMSQGWSNYGYQMALDDNGYNISYRYKTPSGWSDWKALSFGDHSHTINDNTLGVEVASADHTHTIGIAGHNHGFTPSGTITLTGARDDNNKGVLKISASFTGISGTTENNSTQTVEISSPSSTTEVAAKTHNHTLS